MTKMRLVWPLRETADWAVCVFILYAFVVSFCLFWCCFILFVLVCGQTRRVQELEAELRAARRDNRYRFECCNVVVLL